MYVQPIPPGSTPRAPSRVGQRIRGARTRQPHGVTPAMTSHPGHPGHPIHPTSLPHHTPPTPSHPSVSAQLRERDMKHQSARRGTESRVQNATSSPGRTAPGKTRVPAEDIGGGVVLLTPRLQPESRTCAAPCTCAHNVDVRLNLEECLFRVQKLFFFVFVFRENTFRSLGTGG